MAVRVAGVRWWEGDGVAIEVDAEVWRCALGVLFAHEGHGVAVVEFHAFGAVEHGGELVDVRGGDRRTGAAAALLAAEFPDSDRHQRDGHAGHAEREGQLDRAHEPANDPEPGGVPLPGVNPLLVVVSGPPGAGKTTLARTIARTVGCPAICRDELKEGMVHATGMATHELDRRILPAFFGVLGLLLEAGVTTVAEAAFQDRLWRPGLEQLHRLARVRIVHCVVDADVALARARRRWERDPLRRAAHAPPRPTDAFDRVAVDAPWLEVDTTDGYDPDLDTIVRFLNSPE